MLLTALQGVEVITPEQQKAVGLVTGVVLQVVDAIIALYEDRSDVTDEDKKLAADATIAACFAEKFREDE